MSRGQTNFFEFFCVRKRESAAGRICCARGNFTKLPGEIAYLTEFLSKLPKLPVEISDGIGYTMNENLGREARIWEK